MTAKIGTCFTIALLLVMSAQGQYDYNTFPATTIDIKREIFPGEFPVQPLKWGNVNSDCMSKPAEVGFWISYKPKEADFTFTVITGRQEGGKAMMGTLSAPIIYMGTVADHKGNKLLKQVACNTGEVGQKEVSISVTGLVAKQEYFILVTSNTAEKGQTFAIKVEGKYTAPKAAVAAEPEVKKPYAMGRVRTADGKPKSGVVVKLVDKDMQPLETTKSDEQGSFKFEKLPIDQPTIAKIEEDDSFLVIDMFLYDGDGKVKQRATRIGNGLYGFGAEFNSFKQLRLLTENDWKLNVKEGTNGVAGRIVDNQTFLYGQGGVVIGLYTKEKTKIATTTTDVNGQFVFRDVAKGEYSIKMEGKVDDKYSEMVVVDDLNVPFAFANSSMMGTDGMFNFEKLPIEIVEMKRMEERDSRMKVPTDFSQMEDGKPIVLKNILFESGSATLLESSFTELDKLAAELQKRPALKVEISGHTDNTGNAAANLTLSQGRAQAVKDYLMKKGVEGARMTPKGYGQTKPVASNDNEDGKRQNRRVEFVVVK